MTEVDRRLGFVQRNYYLTKRYFLWEFVWLVYTTGNAMSIGFIGVGIDGQTDSNRLTTYLADRRADLVLPLDALRHPVRNGQLGTLGRHDRIHLHVSGQPCDAPDRDEHLRGTLRHRANGDHLRRLQPLLRSRSPNANYAARCWCSRSAASR